MAEFILKDRYGKNRIFDKETIFVKGADGELMQFTHGTGNPVIESLEITENGTYNAPEGLDGYNPVTVNVAGGSAELHYVTFMNRDGTKELGKKAVADGDDCADPIARGIFDTPTEESTDQYDFTFSGSWATVPNGGSDANALKAVTEDRVVYANFIATVRSYTITFYDDDGTTVLATRTVAYGSIPSYTPSKSGVDFDGWEPEVVAVTGEASYKAKWREEVDFATAGWARIIEIAESGEADKYFAVGDEKNVPYGTSSTAITVKIAGFEHDDLANGSGKAGMSIMCMTPVSSQKWIKGSFNSSAGSTYYYGASNNNLNSVLNDSTLYNLPSELRSGIKRVLKKYDTNPNSGNTDTADISCRLWVPSLVELGYHSSYNNIVNLGAKYDVFPEITSMQKVPKATNATDGTNVMYWTRNIYKVGAVSPIAVQNGANSANTQGANLGSKQYYVVFGFCI
jgi:hypothetical protein